MSSFDALRNCVSSLRAPAAALALAIATACPVVLPHMAMSQDLPVSHALPPNRLYADSQIKTLARFSVEITGTGPDLVLIPGLSCSRQVWKQTADRLKKSYTLHLLQIAGFAGEPARDNATGPLLDPVVESIDAYILKAKLSPAVVIGHSLGGTMALRLAQAHPQDVKKVLLVDSLPFYSVLMGGPTATADSMKPMALQYQKQMSAPVADGDAAKSKSMYEKMVTAPADVDRVAKWGAASNRTVVGQALYDDLELDMRPGLASMITPVTLIYPFDEKMGVPQAAWEGLYQAQFDAVPKKTLIRVDGSRHFVMLDQPEKFASAVDGFLSENAVGDKK